MSEEDEIQLIPFFINKNEKINFDHLNGDTAVLRGKEYKKERFNIPVYVNNIVNNCFIWKCSDDEEENVFFDKIINLINNGLGNPTESNNLFTKFIK